MQCLPQLSDQVRQASRELRARNTGAAPEATLSELFSEVAVDGAVSGFLCAQMRDITRPVLWIQDRVSLREAGRPCLAGLPVPLQLLHVTVSKAADLLWTMEEGLRCGGLGAVVGELWGDPPQLDFTATKRLALRSEAQGLPTFLLRRGGQANLSAARLRWRIASLPSLPQPHDSRAPGPPQWRAELFRARWQAPGEWVARHDATGLVLEHDLPTAPADPLERQA